MSELHAPDPIGFNGNLITRDPRQPRAAALAIRHGRTIAAGPDAAISPLAVSRTEKLDLQGRTVVPGFCDSHIHLLWYGMQLLKQADLVGTESIDELLGRLASLASATPDGWIQGHGFDQDKL